MIRFYFTIPRMAQRLSGMLFFHFDRNVRTQQRAGRATRACVLVRHFDNMVAFNVDLCFGQCEQLFGAGGHAHAAALADIFAYRYFGQFLSTFQACFFKFTFI
jgi:hypothetical protein